MLCSEPVAGVQFRYQTLFVCRAKEPKEQFAASPAPQFPTVEGTQGLSMCLDLPVMYKIIVEKPVLGQ